MFHHYNDQKNYGFTAVSSCFKPYAAEPDIEEAHENAIVGRTGASDCADSASFPKPTDDAGMLEAAGYDVWMVAGDPDAFKITTPFDRLIAQALVTRREETND